MPQRIQPAHFSRKLRLPPRLCPRRLLLPALLPHPRLILLPHPRLILLPHPHLALRRPLRQLPHPHPVHPPAQARQRRLPRPLLQPIIAAVGGAPLALCSPSFLAWWACCSSHLELRSTSSTPRSNAVSEADNPFSGDSYFLF